MRIVFNGIGKNKKDEDMKLFSVFRKKAVERSEEIGEGEKPSSPIGGENAQVSEVQREQAESFKYFKCFILNEVMQNANKNDKRKAGLDPF